MDHIAWMYGIRRHSHTFMSEVSKFVEATKKHARICKTNRIRCPCFDCSNNIIWEDTDVIKMYLIKQGFVGGYTIWSHHGDTGDVRVESQVDEKCDVDIEDMLRHIEPEVLLGSFKRLENFETLKKAANDSMYVGCGKEWTVLHFILHLLILKAKFGWSDNSFNDLLTLLGNLLPNPNFIINPLKTRVQRIHVCRNHCILYRGEYTALEKCPNCNASHYKSNTYFSKDRAGSPIRNKRKKVAKKSAGAQVEDESYIGTDMTTQRRVPALVMWYLPLEHRLKRLFSNLKTTEMMTWHVDCPVKDDGKLRQPSDAHQWRTFDANHPKFLEEKKNVKGRTTCLDGTSYVYLKGSMKTVFMRHRRFLLKTHKDRRMKDFFDGTNENDFAPKLATGKIVFEMCEKVKFKLSKKSLGGADNLKRGRKQAKTIDVVDVPFKKMSIFFKYLPYWRELAVRHAIDGMHLQKNVFDSAIRFLGLSGKAKNELKSLYDLVDLQIKPELHP
uniref:Transposase-associated domain-containing protein n=1 Tax=Setaria italica TaxID=4555 RepID=K3Y220_SETIT